MLAFGQFVALIETMRASPNCAPVFATLTFAKNITKPPGIMVYGG